LKVREFDLEMAAHVVPIVPGSWVNHEGARTVAIRVGVKLDSSAHEF
jgi:hypothetical protein